MKAHLLIIICFRNCRVINIAKIVHEWKLYFLSCAQKLFLSFYYDSRSFHQQVTCLMHFDVSAKEPTLGTTGASDHLVLFSAAREKKMKNKLPCRTNKRNCWDKRRYADAQITMRKKITWRVFLTNVDVIVEIVYNSRFITVYERNLLQIAKYKSERMNIDPLRNENDA